MSSHLTDSLIAGAISGGVTRLVAAPLDVLKIRFQLQLEPIKAGSKYSGVLSAVRTIIKEEGLSAFWKGFLPGECLYILYNGAQFMSFEWAKKILHAHSSAASVQNTSGVNFVSGCVGGAVATVTSFPFDVLRTRMIGQGEPKIYKNTFQATRIMFRENGLKTFYKGLTPALLSVVPLTGLVFTFYGMFNYLWDITLEQKLLGAKSLVCGGLAGVIPKLMLMPLDFSKKRLEVQGFESARATFGSVGSYRGFFHCLMTVYREEGPRAFYKGAVPTLLKSAVSVSISFTIYEHTRNLLVGLNS
ncbi:mitochondrial thiamine pyrophosphate carrier-like [Halichondria panicea]|uniref:mitochondrial thiamine pyrophosphate carrier-like n=1 Tax=Halichondria panicea TaxID=6063 RepID=UPI00312B679E